MQMRSVLCSLVLTIVAVPCSAQVFTGSSGSITSFNHFVENVQTPIFDPGDNLLIRATAAIQVAADAPKLGEFYLHVQIYTLGTISQPTIVVHAQDTDTAIIGFGDSQVMIEDTNMLAPAAGGPDRYHTSATLYIIDAQNNIYPLDADEGQFRKRGIR